MLNKPEFVTLLAERCEVTKVEAEAMYDDVFSTLTDVIASGEEVNISGLGRVKVVDRPASRAHKPRTDEAVEVPAKKAPKCQFAKNVKEAVAEL